MARESGISTSEGISKRAKKTGGKAAGAAKQ
jgi:hypothetical protein